MSNEEKTKSYSKEEINILVAQQLKICIEPICKEIGEALMGLQSRISDLEMTVNSIVTELKEWKSGHGKTIQ